MDAERWKRINEIFHAALERDPPDRSSFIAEACNGDISLCAEIEQLIANHLKESSLFQKPAADIAAEFLARQDRIQANIYHYKILKKLGSGGMGVVYLAEDTRLHRKVALKVLALQFTNDKERVRRFEREAKTLTALNHPCILTIFDIGEINSTTFIASEYIDGQTLRQHMRSSKLTLKEILTIVIQVAEALNAAHQAGIIHRDIKPENIMLRRDGYVKILDFGLAKSIEIASANKSELKTISELTTEHGVLIGTLSYMSPEQIRHQKVDARTDLFSLGVVLYEMITGHSPFEGNTTADLIASILQKRPAPLLTYGEFPEELQWIITKALSKDPEERYQSANELITDLKRVRKHLDLNEELKLSDSSPTATPLNDQKMLIAQIIKNRIVGITVILAVILIAALAGYKYLRPNKSLTLSAASKPRTSIAVLGFKNLSENARDNWISLAIAEMLTTELAAGEQLRMIPGETVTRVKEDLSLPDVQTFEKETLEKIGTSLAVEYIVLGSYVSTGNNIRFDLRIQDTRSGETRAAFSENGSRDALPDLASRSSRTLRKYLNVESEFADEEANETSFPSNPEAIRLYAEGLSRLRTYEFGPAKDALEKVVELEPNFAMGHSALNEVWSEIGNKKNAKLEAQNALDLSQNLSRQDKLLVQARLHQASDDWKKTIETYQSLFQLYPDNIEYGLKLAEAQYQTSATQDVFITVQKMRKQQKPQVDDPRIDIIEARTLSKAGRYRDMLQRSLDAAQKAERIGSNRLLARAFSLQSSALYQLGKVKEAEELYYKAQKFYSTAKDPQSRAQNLESQANNEIDNENYQKAEQLLQEALQIYEETGDKTGVADVYFMLASTTRDPVKIDEFYGNALSTYEEIENYNGMGAALTNWGLKKWNFGKGTEGQQLLEQALTYFRKAGNSDNTTSALINTAAFYHNRGDLTKALSILEESAEMENAMGHKICWAEKKVQAIANLMIDQGELAKAKQVAESALPIFRESENKEMIAITQNKIAYSLLLQGKITEAKKIWREAEQISKSLQADPVLYKWTLYSIQETQRSILSAEGKIQEILNESPKIKEPLLNDEYSNHALDEIDLETATLLFDIDQEKARQVAERLLKKIETQDPISFRSKVILELAKMDLAEEQVAAADLRMKNSEPLFRQFQEYFAIHVGSEIINAMILAHKGDIKHAKEMLERLFEKTRNAGYATLEYEVLLALGEAELRGGNRDQGVATLQKLKQDAEQKGYLYVSQKAKRVLATPPMTKN
jgi:serine/threonine protein kinase/tetratricopeptide (TPR) repeat protein